VADGGLDISKPAVRAAINAAVASVVAQPAVTPYVVFNRLSKLLAQYHIILPKRFLEGDKGVEVFELRQFGHKMGMTDSGEFINEVPSTHYLFLQYGIISTFGITYAKPVVGGMFKVMAKVVDKEELDKLMDMAEITMAEEAEVNQNIAKANAPRDPMHDVTSDEKKKGNKEAVAASEKKSLDEEQIDEVSIGKLIRYKREREGDVRATNISASHSEDMAKHPGVSSGKRKEFGDEAKWLRGKQEKMKAGIKLADAKLKGKSKVGASMPKNPYMEEEKDPCWKGYEMIGMKKKGGNPVPNCVPVKEEEQIDELKKSTLGSYIKKASDSRAKNQGDAEFYQKKGVNDKNMKKYGKSLRNVINRRKGIRTAAEKLAKEETQIDEISRETARSYLQKSKGPRITLRKDREHMKHGAGDKKEWDDNTRKLRNKIQGRANAEDRLFRKEETIAEKAPPGAKFERMVKHIKKGYAKDGELTAKEKGIAFATAWKAKKKSED
jgi:hypothetical protein